MFKCEKVYIVIVNYNGWIDTLECLESVLRNTYDQYQVIIVDNNSSDESIHMLQEWCNGNINIITGLNQDFLVFPPIKKPVSYHLLEYKGSFETLENKENSSLIIIKNNSNNGFAAGNNIAILFAKLQNDFEYIWLLNNDTVIQPDTLTELVFGINKYDNCAAVGSKILYYSHPNILQSIGSINHAKVINGNHTIDNGQYDQDMQVDDIMGASLLVRKNIIETVGLMPEYYFLYGEETEWCDSFIKYGFRLFYIYQSKVYHKKSVSTGGDKSPLALYYQTRNSYILAKHVMTNKKYRLYVIQNTFRRLKRFLKVFLFKPTLSKFILWGILDGLKGSEGKTRRKLQNISKNNLNDEMNI